MTDYIIVRDKFYKFMQYVYEKNYIDNDSLNFEIINNLTQLVSMWNNVNNDIDFFMSMKNHHTYINGKLGFDKNLEELWNDYLESGLEFRVSLMQTQYKN